MPGQGREMKYCGSAQELADFLRGFCNDGTDPVFDREGSSPDCLDAAGRLTGSLDCLLLAPKYEADGCGGIEGEIAVSLEECIACGSTGFGTAEFLDLAARRLAGSPCLTDINYEAVRCTGKGRIVLKVNGFFLEGGTDE